MCFSTWLKLKENQNMLEIRYGINMLNPKTVNNRSVIGYFYAGIELEIYKTG